MITAPQWLKDARKGRSIMDFMSKKFWITIISLVLPVVINAIGLKEFPLEAAMTVITYLLMQGLVDYKKASIAKPEVK